jgi:hypothetical protein
MSQGARFFRESWPTTISMNSRSLDALLGSSSCDHFFNRRISQILLSSIEPGLGLLNLFPVTQSTSPWRGANNVFPSGVILYSTRGGTSGNNSLFSNPSRSKLRRVSVNIRCEIPGIDLSSSENRARQPGSFSRVKSINMPHLSPIFDNSSRTAIGSLLLQT